MANLHLNLFTVCIVSYLTPCLVILCQTILKEGQLMKQTTSFQRWKRRYFKLRGRTLYYAQTAKVATQSKLACQTYQHVALC